MDTFKTKTSISRWCAVPSCNYNSSKIGHSFFASPKDRDRLLQWIDLCNRPDLLKKDLSKVCKTTFICGQHFEYKMFANDLRNRLQSHAVPTIFSVNIVLDEASTSQISNTGCQQENIHTKEIKAHSVEQEPTPKIRILENISLNLPEDKITENIQVAALSVHEKVPVDIAPNLLDLKTDVLEVIPDVSTKSLQADIQPSMSSVALQTRKHLSAISPRKQKLRKTLVHSRKKILKLQKKPTFK